MKFEVRTSDFVPPTSYLRLRTSDFLLQTSYFRLPTSDFLLQTSYFRLPTSDFLLQTSLSCLSYLVGPEATGADANALDPAIDHRPHRLKIRLEPARAHVVRVAVLPTNHRAFPTHLTSLRHQGTIIEITD